MSVEHGIVASVTPAQQEEEPQEIASQDETTPPPSPRITRARAHGTPQPHAQPTRNPSTRKQPTASAESNRDQSKPNRSQKNPLVQQRSQEEDAADDETEDDDGDYVHVNVGDCVLLDSGDADENYIALVSAVQPSQNRAKAGMFTAQWYYKPEDVKESVLRTIPNGLLPNEVFLSPHKDKNSMDAVIDTCQVVSPGEYDEIQHEIARGFREKTSKQFFVCRYKYWPSRQGKRALEELKHNEVRSGLGRPTPNVGSEFQADIPEMSPEMRKLFYETGPALFRAVTVVDAEHNTSSPSRGAATPESKSSLVGASSVISHRSQEFPYSPVWSPDVAFVEETTIRTFREMLDPIKYACGNILKTFRYDEQRAPLRCLIISSSPLEICTSKGLVKKTHKSELSSPLADDIALKHLFTSKFNIAVAIEECAKVINDVREQERIAFKQEVKLFAQLRAQEESGQRCDQQDGVSDDANSERKRRK